MTVKKVKPKAYSKLQNCNKNRKSRLITNNDNDYSNIAKPIYSLWSSQGSPVSVGVRFRLHDVDFILNHSS